MIARDNETRARLNDAARAHRADAGELGEERTFGGTPVAVGDRVICRDNDARVQVDNGTRGTVRHVTRAGVVLETDGGAVRELPAGYVADHVEHAYCLTGHGMQGGTVERAFVVASPEDLTAGWSYSALSRARGATRLLIADQDRRAAERDELAPRRERPTRQPRRTSWPEWRDGCWSATTRTWRSTRSRPPAARTTRRLRPTAPRAERFRRRSPRPCAGNRADREPESADRPARTDQPPPTRTRRAAYPAAGAIRRARRQGTRTRRQREEHAERLAALDPPTRRLGRVRDAHADERSFLETALEMDERALSEVRAERTRLQRELGDPDQVRSEREGIETAIDQLQQDYDQVRDVLADRLLDRRPSWLIDALGDRPEHARESETWDRAARSVAAFRLDHDISDSRTALGPEPSLGDTHRHEWDQANALLERAQRQLAHQPPAREHGLDLGIG